MTADRFQEVFATIGKLIYFNQLGTEQATDLKSALVAIQQQTASATLATDPYAALNGFVGPTVANSRNIVQSLDRVGLVAKAGVENYVRSLAGELGAAPTLTPSSLLSALAEAMTDAEQTVVEGGVIFQYILDRWSVSLPTADEEDATISDELVTAELV